MKRLGLGVLFFGWLYGAPFLLLVGLLWRRADPRLATRAEAVAFGAATDAVLVAGVCVAVGLPLVGLLLARLAGEAGWVRRFGWSLLGAFGLLVALSVVRSQMYGPLIGHVPDDDGPRPAVTVCVPRSGGHSCPGG